MMRLIKQLGLLTALTISVLSSCIERFEPEIGEYENLLVIEGRLTNQPPPYEVILSTSADIVNPALVPLERATVVLADDEGNKETLTEVSPGRYLSSAGGMRGEVGKSYQIEIQSNGKSYASGLQRLNKPVPIENVYAEQETRQDLRFSYDLDGYQFFIDMNAETAETNYFFWDLEATYKFTSDFDIPYYYDGAIREFPTPLKYKTCWKTVEVSDIFTFDTKILTEPKLERFPLHYQDTESRDLAIRYSLLTKQYSINEDTYLFWNALKDQAANQGSLYSKQPYQIRGNVANVDNPDEPVLGYFMVAGVSEKRIFVRRPTAAAFHYPICGFSDPVTAAWDMRALRWSNPADWPIFIAESPTGVREVPALPCVDCRAKDGTIFKPSFWED